MMNHVIIPSLFVFILISLILCMYISIIKDLAQIRAAQKFEIESMLRMMKYLNEDKKDE